MDIFNTREHFNSFTGDKGIQNIYTPVKELVAYSNLLKNELNLDNVKDGAKIAIIYNYEWFEYFVNNYTNLNRFNWTYFYDSEFDKCMFFRLAMLINVDKIDYIKIEDKVPEFTATMKFDKIIMNPPYCKNLHLKILAEAIEHLTDDGECVNLSPIYWLQDPLAEIKNNTDYKKFETSVSKHIVDIDEISIIDSQKMFNAGMMTMLGIYVLTNKNEHFDYKNFKWKFTNKTLFDKIIFNGNTEFPSLSEYSEDKVPNVFVPIKLIANPGRTTAYNVCTSTFQWIVNSNLPDGKYWKEGIYKSKSLNNEKMPVGVWFKNESYAKNFYYSTYTTFYKFSNFIVKGGNQHINHNFLLWLGDAVNPRTGKKGYESEWTNEDFYKFFNITPEEQKLIEETMEKYK